MMTSTVWIVASLGQTQPATPQVGAAPAAGAAPARTEVIGAPAGSTPGVTPANTTTVQQPAGAQPAGSSSPQGGFGQLIILLPIVLLFGFMFWSTSRAQKKERQRRDELLNSLSNNDTVQTVGGVIGRIAEIKDDEIILRVDESTNTKIRFSRAAVQQVLHKSGAGAASQSEAKPVKQTAKV